LLASSFTRGTVRPRHRGDTPRGGEARRTRYRYYCSRGQRCMCTVQGTENELIFINLFLLFFLSSILLLLLI
jgi:hypothetical protein